MLIIIFSALYPIAIEGGEFAIDEYFFYYAYLVTALVKTAYNWKLASTLMIISHGVLYYHFMNFELFREVKIILALTFVCLSIF